MQRLLQRIRKGEEVTLGFEQDSTIVEENFKFCIYGIHGNALVNLLYFWKFIDELTDKSGS